MTKSHSEQSDPVVVAMRALSEREDERTREEFLREVASIAIEFGSEAAIEFVTHNDAVSIVDGIQIVGEALENVLDEDESERRYRYIYDREFRYLKARRDEELKRLATAESAIDGGGEV